MCTCEIERTLNKSGDCGAGLHLSIRTWKACFSYIRGYLRVRDISSLMECSRNKACVCACVPACFCAFMPVLVFVCARSAIHLLYARVTSGGG